MIRFEGESETCRVYVKCNPGSVSRNISILSLLRPYL